MRKHPLAVVYVEISQVLHLRIGFSQEVKWTNCKSVRVSFDAYIWFLLPKYLASKLFKYIIVPGCQLAGQNYSSRNKCLLSKMVCNPQLYSSTTQNGKRLQATPRYVNLHSRQFPPYS